MRKPSSLKYFLWLIFFLGAKNSLNDYCHTDTSKWKNLVDKIKYREIIWRADLPSVGMAISRVFRVTRPTPLRLERVWEHKNRGWDGFRFKKKTRIGFGAGSGLVTICPAPPRIWIYKFTPTYKYLLPILSDLPLPFSLRF